MRKSILLLLAAAVVMTAIPAFAELQNVTVGGSLKVRGNWYTNTFTAPAAAEIRWPGFFLPKRAIGDILGGNNVASPYSWGGFRRHVPDTKSIEQYTRLNVRADFTNDVSAFIETDSYGLWGTDFRSNYITGADFRNLPGAGASITGNTNDLDLYQGYIQASNMFGYPLRLRIGRQELAFGNEWLVGSQGTNAGLSKTSFDAIRLTYATDQFSVDTWAAKLAELSPLEQDGDVDFYGVYASYLGIQNLTLDAYWMYIRDARKIKDTNLLWFGEWVEDLLNIDNYNVTNLHTIGLRGAGTYGAFDFNGEVAYQLGDSDAIGTGFKFLGSPYGDQRSSFDGNWGANAELGYTFDMSYTPRVFVGGAYFGGEDNRDISFWQWLNPFARPKASISFNRLFSSWEYSEFIDNPAVANLSNAWLVRGGVKVNPTEATEVLLTLSYFQSLDDFRAPAHFNIGRFRVPIAPALSFWDQSNSSDLGFELGLVGTYHYSEDLTFKGGYSHFFVGNGLRDGNYNAMNGLGFDGGNGRKDADYLFFETSIAF